MRSWACCLLLGAQLPLLLLLLLLQLAGASDTPPPMPVAVPAAAAAAADEEAGAAGTLPGTVAAAPCGSMLAAAAATIPAAERPNFVFSPHSIFAVLSLLAEGVTPDVQQTLLPLLALPPQYYHTLGRDSSSSSSSSRSPLLSGLLRLQSVAYGYQLQEDEDRRRRRRQRPWHQQQQQQQQQQEEEGGAAVLQVLSEVFADASLQQQPGFGGFEERVAAALGHQGVHTLDAESAAAAAAMLNARVAAATRNRITDLFSPDDITKLILLNAIYFKAGWLDPFSETESGPFLSLTPSGVRTTQVQYMQQQLLQHQLLLLQQDGVTVVGLPLSYPGAFMFFYVPEDFKTFENMVKSNPLLLQQLVDKCKEGAPLGAPGGAPGGPLEQRVQLFVPKFELAAAANQMDASQLLQQLGVSPKLWEGGAFAGIGSPLLSLSKLLHAAYMAVDENGVEAAAATAALVADGAGRQQQQQQQVRIDRPFFFEVRLLDFASSNGLQQHQFFQQQHSMCGGGEKDVVLFAGRVSSLGD